MQSSENSSTEKSSPKITECPDYCHDVDRRKEKAEQFKVTKEKWEITIDLMMIIGKYFESNGDYINVMKLTKRYHDLTQMYHFNPIQDCSLFENMETQYLYNDFDEKKEGMNRYIYWYLVRGSHKTCPKK